MYEIITTGIAHPVVGSPFQVQGVFGKTVLIRAPLLRRKPTCGFDYVFVKHVLELLIIIYVCIKSDVTTLETIII